MGLNDWLKDLGSLLDLIQNVAQQGGTATYHGETCPEKEGKGLRATYDIRLRVGSLSDGLSRQRESPQESEVKNASEPIIDMFDEPRRIVIIAQMPGVAEDEVQLSIKGDILILRAEGKNRRYYRELLLPFAPDQTGCQTSLTNGVLEVRIEKPAGYSKK